MNLTKNEKRLKNLIDKIDNNDFILERDRLFIDVLQYVNTISQDSNLKKLLNVIKENFKEYGV